ncbi:hypothetical protein L1887_00088 [Cichorium endivia]|nr:hypothetical protein L1887_00088 [Cichorium endivia]
MEEIETQSVETVSTSTNQAHDHDHDIETSSSASGSGRTDEFNIRLVNPNFDIPDSAIVNPNFDRHLVQIGLSSFSDSYRSMSPAAILVQLSFPVTIGLPNGYNQGIVKTPHRIQTCAILVYSTSNRVMMFVVVVSVLAGVNPLLVLFS